MSEEITRQCTCFLLANDYLERVALPQGSIVLILLLVYGVVRFKDRQADLRQAFQEDMPLLRPLADKLHFNLDDSGVVHTIQRLLA